MMPKAKKDQGVKESGTSKPLPTDDGSTEQKELAKANEAKAAVITEELTEQQKEIAKRRAEIKALQDKIKAEKDKIKAEQQALKAQKDAEKEEAKKLREEAEAAIKVADEDIAKAQADLEKTEEWKALVAAKAVREAIGPLPKAKRGGGRKRDPNASPSAGEFGMERSSDVPWCEKKGVLLKTLFDGGASDALSAMSTAEVVDSSGLSGRDVRHYGYHAKAGGLVDVATIEGKRGYCFFLTEKGVEELNSHS